MIDLETNIHASKATLSLIWDKDNDLLSGDTTFDVRVNDVGTAPPSGDYSVFTEIDPFFILTPNWIADAKTAKTIEIGYDTAQNLPIGNYQYELRLSSTFAKDTVIFIFLKVVSEYEGEVVRDYKLKYFFENMPKDLYRCEIFEDKYYGQPIEVNGKVELKYQEKSDHFQPIVASNLKITLNANEDFTFQDLYSEDEQHFKVILKRNNLIIFIGFLKPDGIWEDYVYDKWELSLDAFDGLSTLKNISFSNDNGVSFSGKTKAFDIIYTILKKTGLDLPININCRVFYQGWSGSENIFDLIYLNTERYNQSNSDPMDCENVLKSILQLFNASLIQHMGEWFLYRPIDLRPGGTQFNRYVDRIYESLNFILPEITIGSQINGFELFHCNANQKKSISPSVQAYRVTYQYGNANSIYINSELKLSGSGLEIPGWTVENIDGKVERLSSGSGLTSKTYTGSGDPKILALNQSVDVNGGAMIKMIIRFGNYNFNSVGLRFVISVGGKFFNIETGQWQDEGYLNFVANYRFDGWWPDGSKKCIGLGDATYELVVQSPVSGNFYVEIYRDKHPLGGGDFNIYSVLVQPNDSGNIKGREYTAQRTKRISTVIKPNITLYNGDSISDLFVGTIYKNDADTPTELWESVYKPGVFKELLAINAEDNLRIAPRPMVIFEGDVYGYLPFLSFIKFDQFNEKEFQPTSYTFDTSTGITKLVSREFSSAYLVDKDFKPSVKDNYGNETKVTIV